MLTRADVGMTLETLRRDYSAMRPQVESFTERIDTLIAELLQRHGAPVQAIEARTRSVSSFLRKVQRADKAYGDPLREVTDLSRVRIIARCARDVEPIGQVLRREFRVECAHPADMAHPFGADQSSCQSIRSILRLDPARAALTEWRDYRDLTVEVQVRTMLQHAWASIDRGLTGKLDTEAPKPLRHRLHRISALLQAADAAVTDLHDALAQSPSQPHGPQFHGLQLHGQSPATGHPVDAADVAPGVTAVDALSLQTYLDDRGIEAFWESLLEQAGFAPAPSPDGGMAARSNLLAFLGVAGIASIEALDRRLAVAIPVAPVLFRAIRSVWDSLAPGCVPAANACAAMRIALLFGWPRAEAMALLEITPFAGAMQTIVTDLVEGGKFAMRGAMAA